MNDLVEALRARGVIAADAPAPPADTLHRPWFIALMLGFAGWLAGILLLAFIGMTFKLESTSAILVVGVVLCGAAWALYFADRNAVFLDQLALALSIAGQCAIAWALLDDVRSGLAIAATLLVLQLVVLLVMPNKTARTLAALFASIAWVYTIRFLVRGGSLTTCSTTSTGAAGFPNPGPCRSPGCSPGCPLFAARWLTRRENVWMAHACGCSPGRCSPACCSACPSVAWPPSRSPRSSWASTPSACR